MLPGDGLRSMDGMADVGNDCSAIVLQEGVLWNDPKCKRLSMLLLFATPAKSEQNRDWTSSSALNHMSRLLARYHVLIPAALHLELAQARLIRLVVVR